MSNIRSRRQTHFVLWCPEQPANAPELVIGQLVNGNPPKLKDLRRFTFQLATDVQDLWQIDAATCTLAEGGIYHYWFVVDDGSGTGRIQVTDPMAFCVDYRLCGGSNPPIQHPPAVLRWNAGKLSGCDPNGEIADITTVPLSQLPANNRLVIYELPTAWTSCSGNDEFERAVGTFRDVHALVDSNVEGANFPDLAITSEGHHYLLELGVNALEMLPPADSIYSREWGYGTSHYFAPDYELGYPEGHLSPTSNHDLTALVNACHRNGIRIFMDVVLGFMKLDPYRHIDFDNFYLENPKKHPGDPDAYNSREGGGRHFRDPYGASCPRYHFTRNTYDPISGTVKVISPVRQYMLAFLERWMHDFHIDGIRMDSVENVANWDFIQSFRDAAHNHFSTRYPGESEEAKQKFLVVGEELSMPPELLSQKRLDGLWNESFQAFVRAAILGENAGALNEPSFEWTVRRAIDCRIDGWKGSQVINYLTSHDVEGSRKERMYNMVRKVITLENSSFLFNRNDIEAEVKEIIKREDIDILDVMEIKRRTDEKILHRARLRRIRLAFVCQMTAVGIPMILAGEEFGDQHDLFNASGQVSHTGGKQVDPVNFSRAAEPDRRELFNYVSRLVKLRTAHPALWVNDTHFFHIDFGANKRVLAWKRGTTDPVIVVANFSDYTTPNALSPTAEYKVNNWPATPLGHHWFEVTQGRKIGIGRHDKEPIFAWEAKVYRLVKDS